MNWRNPKKELPAEDQMVWVMLEPHKDRGGLLKSAPSIEIVCGWAEHYPGGECRVGNNDELGLGAVGWQLVGEPGDYDDAEAIAWLPVSEMPFPDWRK